MAGITGGYREGAGRKSKFDEYDYRQIKKKREKGVSAVDLAKIYGVHYNTIYNILNRYEKEN